MHSTWQRLLPQRLTSFTHLMMNLLKRVEMLLVINFLSANQKVFRGYCSRRTYQEIEEIGSDSISPPLPPASLFRSESRLLRCARNDKGGAMTMTPHPDPLGERDCR